MPKLSPFGYPERCELRRPVWLIVEGLFLDREERDYELWKASDGSIFKAVTGLVLLLCLHCDGTTRECASRIRTRGLAEPILVITSSSATFGKYYAEILRTEGLNEFTVSRYRHGDADDTGLPMMWSSLPVP